MIQRIQTIYLLFTAIISGGLIFLFDLWTNVAKEKVFVVDLFQANLVLHKLIPVCFLMSAIGSFIAVFLYKNRQLQFVVGRIIILINLFLLGILIYVSQTLSGEASVSLKGIGMLIPVIVILLIFLANKAIKKDENLVKSVDRLR
jgi:hypothetical protein